MSDLAWYLNEGSSAAIVFTSWMLAHQSSRYRGVFTWPASTLCALFGLVTLFIMLFRHAGVNTLPAIILGKVFVSAFLGVIAFRIWIIRREVRTIISSAHVDPMPKRFDY